MPVLRLQQPRAPCRRRRGTVRARLRRRDRGDRGARAEAHRVVDLLWWRHAVADAAFHHRSRTDAIARNWNVAARTEVTLEANPTSVEATRFRGYRTAGVNRVSLGVQALDDRALTELGRLHSAREALDAVGVARSVFDRYSFDLIYARPGQTPSQWASELKRALELASICRFIS